MSDFIQVSGWAQHSRPDSKRSFQQLRSTFASPPSGNIPKPPLLSRPASKSTSHLQTMATVSSVPSLPTRKMSYNDEDSNMSTLPDPRSRTMSPANVSSPSNTPQHPDLSNEVATLSNKLINAINLQTNLDDTLSATRHELESSKERVRQLEKENQDHKDMITRGILIRKSISEVEKSKLSASLAEEKRQRAVVEKEKKGIEQELETLTTALFEEANKMVITAREAAQKEFEAVQRRNDQLTAQLADTESLLKNHQQQLAELKQVMEHLTEEHDDQTNQTAPSTPGLSKFDSQDDIHDLDAVASIPDAVSPSYPTSFTHLLHMVLRTDLSSYEEFTSLLRMSKNVVGSRVSSGSYGNIGLGLGLGGHNPAQPPTNGSTSSLSAHGSTPATPTTPASSVSSGSTNGPNSLTPLKETKFYKRAIAEDIEPTLRLDTAPGLSWLARRTVLNAICEGNLVVEPMPISTKLHIFACSLCGETRKDPTHVRSHRFRTSENENAQRYPLCKYCLGRIRSTCDYLGFLRILKEGHWRADDEESEKAAWEESVRLREQMFWCRVGGGVIPAQASSDTSRSPRASEDDRRDQEAKLSEELHLTGEIQPKDITPVVGVLTTSSPKRSSNASLRENVAVASPSIKQKTDGTTTASDSNLPTSSPQVTSPRGEGIEGVTRLSITIPGSFE